MLHLLLRTPRKRILLLSSILHVLFVHRRRFCFNIATTWCGFPCCFISSLEFAYCLELRQLNVLYSCYLYHIVYVNAVI